MPSNRDRIRTRNELPSNTGNFLLSQLTTETRKRSLAKTITYRAASTALLAVITFYLTGNAGEATTITLLFSVGASVVYYVLERLWNSVKWGKKQIGHHSGVGALDSLGTARADTRRKEG